MLVRDVLELVKLRSSNIALSKNDAALIKFIYLGVSELYRLFNLSIKEETIKTTSNIAYYELRNPDVSLLINVYDMCGVELHQSDVINSHAWDMKIVNYRSFLLHHPHDTFLYALYKAAPVKFQDPDDIIYIPDAMIDALLCYVTYMLQSTITSSTSVLGRGSSLEATQYYQMFKAACQELEMQGFKIPLDAEQLSVIAKGYV